MGLLRIEWRIGSTLNKVQTRFFYRAKMSHCQQTYIEIKLAIAAIVRYCTYRTILKNGFSDSSSVL